MNRIYQQYWLNMFTVSISTMSCTMRLIVGIEIKWVIGLRVIDLIFLAALLSKSNNIVHLGT